MNLSPTLALLRKDLRLNRAPMLGGAALIFMPYLIGFAAFFTIHQKEFSSIQIRDSFASCPILAMALTYAICAVFGGVAFAYERREGWGDFLAMMPTSRVRSICSKLLVSLVFLLPVWAINLYAAHWLLKTQVDEIVYMFVLSGGMMLMCFGIAWLISALQSSAALAACASIGIALVFGLLFTCLPQWRGIYDLYQAIVLALIGIICFFTGSIYHVRRVEP